jgi:ketosteroid isomerase-like protein
VAHTEPTSPATGTTSTNEATATPSAGSLVTALVSAFGDPNAIEALLHEDATWWITPTTGMLGTPATGRDKIIADMRVIFGTLYADARVNIHDVIEQDDRAAARITLHATALFADRRPYTNEYCLWIRARDGKIAQVWEYLDVAQSTAQFATPSPEPPSN